MDHHEDESNSKQVDEVFVIENIRCNELELLFAERAAALAEGLPAPTLCSSGDVRDLNIEYFKYAHQHVLYKFTASDYLPGMFWQALAGVSTEYLIYGFSEGGLDDIRKLDLLLKGLGFTQKKADSHVRWPLLNTVLVLWRHEAARGKVAEALSMGKSIGSCIDIIENSINVSDLLLKL
ncbi:uncharacterized protein LOC114420538 [Glycine soja]|uniref:uncharacterized protein n=1 Tax=Glycine max TaxID=3847 RepID=UPI0007192ACF|nr:uncharacterized protein LOC106799279 [Glycine max]XP_028242208.1 uncharacterized protein LOC114420538 [Glycine soja]|eukprot:XP_014632959.1 uncharacterized protein LOC106799279 [Glycine max]